MFQTRFKGDELLFRKRNSFDETASALREKIQKELKCTKTDNAKKACRVDEGFMCPVCCNVSSDYLHVCHEGELAKRIVNKILLKYGHNKPFSILLEHVRNVHKHSKFQVACSTCNSKLEKVGHKVKAWFDGLGWQDGRIVCFDPIKNKRYPYLIKFYDDFEEWVSNPDEDDTIIYYDDEYDYD